VRAHLDERVESVAKEATNRVREPHGRPQVADPVSRVEEALVVHLAERRRIERNGPRLGADSGERFVQVGRDRIHLWAVGRNVDANLARENLQRLELRKQLVERVGVTRHDGRRAAVVACDREPPAEPRQQPRDRRRREVDDAHASLAPHAAHELAALTYHRDRIVEVERAGDVCRGDLAHAVADDRTWRDAEGAPERGERRCDREQDRLSVVDFVEAPLCVLASNLSQRRPAHALPHGGVDALELRSKYRLAR
jgi:hypothetical protein